jgi:hypothetical protein
MKKPANLVYGVEEEPPIAITVISAIQHVGVTADPGRFRARTGATRQALSRRRRSRRDRKMEDDVELSRQSDSCRSKRADPRIAPVHCAAGSDGETSIVELEDARARP